jgi:membrane-bound ClpP family serine protease
LNQNRKLRTIILCCLLVVPIASSVHIQPAQSKGNNSAVLVRIDSAIDYKTVDLLDEAARDIEEGRAATLLIQLNSDAGYSAPTLNIVNKLRSLNVTTVAYVGPNGAIASGYAAYLAMASKVLAMNEGTIIGFARITPGNSAETNSLMNLMRELATSAGRSAEAAERMAIDNLAYSAQEAYAKGVCDLVVDSYESLLKKLGIDAASVIDKAPSLSSYVNYEGSYGFFKLLVDPTTIKYLFFAVAGLVCLNLMFAIARPRKTRRDETYQPLLDLMRMEIQSSLTLDTNRTAVIVHETPLHTPTNIPSDPTFKLSRLPTFEPDRRMERPLEVRKRQRNM